MAYINIHDAKTHFSRLVKQALKGEEVIIAKRGVPLVKLTPYEKPTKNRKGGQLKGILITQDNFDDPLPDEYLKSFSGEEET